MKISLVMIVKNEEKVLRRCLESVKAIVDEFIICDTGSTDGTKNIIIDYGPVFDAPFTNFVETKNKALALATGDYVLVMDADESVETGLEFLREHAETGADAVGAMIVEGRPTSNSYYRPRFWRRDLGWRFDGPGVHEVPGGAGKIIYDARITVRHDHSHRNGDYRLRFEKYIEILTAYLADHPNDHRATFYMARTHKDLGNWLAAIEWYEKYLALNGSFRDERWQAAYDTALCWKAQGEYDQAMMACQRAIELDERRAEAYVLLGQMYFRLQEWDRAVEFFWKAVKPVPADVLLFINLGMYNEIPLDFLMICYDRQRLYRSSLNLCKKFMTMPVDQRVINNLVWLRPKTHLTLFFALGHTPEPVYGGMIAETGVGGVETTYLELPRALAERGHNVFVFCRCDQEHVHGGVRFIPWQKLGEYTQLNPDVTITSRWFDALYTDNPGKRIIWTQDAHFADPNRPDAFSLADAVVCSSLWHRQYIAERFELGIEAKKIHVIPLGIDKSLFAHSQEKDPLKVIYSSNPDRGLYILQEMWAEISAAAPGIHLTVTYGWEGLKTWSDDPDWLAKINQDKARLERWAKDAGNVTFTGRLKKAELAQEMMTASLCLYPNNFWETFCLTALESQAAGMPMVTSRLGALATTLHPESNVLLPGNPGSDDYKARFVAEVKRLMSDRAALAALAQGCRDYAIAASIDWGDIGDEWERLIWSL